MRRPARAGANAAREPWLERIRDASQGRALRRPVAVYIVGGVVAILVGLLALAAVFYDMNSCSQWFECWAGVQKHAVLIEAIIALASVSCTGGLAFIILGATSIGPNTGPLQRLDDLSTELMRYRADLPR